MDLGARAEAGIAAVVITLVVIGGSVMLLTNPLYVRIVVEVVDSAATTDLGESVTNSLAEDVRRFVVDPDAPDLPATVGGAPAFDAAAVDHLIDVRQVMVPAWWLTLALSIVLTVWVAWRRRSKHGLRVMAAASGASSALMIGGAALALVAGLVDFNALFAWFHSLFFAEGTWVFPYEALLIRVFPLPFWIVAGATWGGLVLIASVVLCRLSRWLRFTAGTYGV